MRNYGSADLRQPYEEKIAAVSKNGSYETLTSTMEKAQGFTA